MDEEITKLNFIEHEDMNDKDDKVIRKVFFGFFGCTRYLMLIIFVFCLTVAKSNEFAFNIVVLCMTSNSTTNQAEKVNLTPQQISSVFASCAVGAIIFVLPLSQALHKFGARFVYGSAMLLLALASALFPLAATTSYHWLLFVRAILGLSLAAHLPMVAYFSTFWAPSNEIANFMTFLTASGQLSQILTMPLDAHLCETFSWKYTFYFHSVITLMFAGVFILVYRNNPREHCFVSEKELALITKNGRLNSMNKNEVPYRSILKSRPVWAVWIAFIGIAFGFHLVVLFMPIYLNKVMNVAITKTGFSAVLPPLAQLLAKMPAGLASDKIKFLSEKRKIQMFNSMSLFGAGLSIIPLAFLSKNSPNIALLCFTLSLGSIGLVTCGAIKSASMIAREFSHSVLAISQLVICIGMLVVPYVVGWLAPNLHEIREWRYVVLTVALVLFTSNIMFCFLCSAEPEPWTFSSKQQSLELISKYDAERN